jgi:hypothetical protein
VEPRHPHPLVLGYQSVRAVLAVFSKVELPGVPSPEPPPKCTHLACALWLTCHYCEASCWLKWLVAQPGFETSRLHRNFCWPVGTGIPYTVVSTVLRMVN